MTKPLAFVLFVLLASPAFAQSTAAPPAHSQLGTPKGHTLNVSLAGYTYGEPSNLSITIHGPKVGGEYTGTFSLGAGTGWFAQANARGTIGNTTYDGWCSPWQIEPNSSSPNGYQLGFGDASPCSESGDKDWYGEARGLIGKDTIKAKWGFAPYGGLGFRHLSNATGGIPAYRIDNYLYAPVGVTVRTMMGSQHVVSVNGEFDVLLHGWQTTHDSQFGSGIVPATPIAPPFSLDSFTDIAFPQHQGWAARTSATFEFNARWSVEPYFVYWHVGDSPAMPETVTFTVNGITAQEQLGFYEPLNYTRELGVKLGFRF